MQASVAWSKLGSYGHEGRLVRHQAATMRECRYEAGPSGSYQCSIAGTSTVTLVLMFAVANKPASLTHVVLGMSTCGARHTDEVTVSDLGLHPRVVCREQGVVPHEEAVHSLCHGDTVRGASIPLHLVS